MPLLARTVVTPLTIDVAAARWRTWARSSPTGGSRPAASGGRGRSRPGRTDRRPSAPGPGRGRLFTVAGGTIDAAIELAEQLRAAAYDALVGIGGGKTIDTAKYAATRLGIPMVSVATSLANDGIASPVASLDHDGHRVRSACTSRSPWSSTWTSWRTGRTGSAAGIGEWSAT